MFCRRGTDEVPGCGAAPLNAGGPKEEWPSRNRIQRVVSRLSNSRQITKKPPPGRRTRETARMRSPGVLYRPALTVRVVRDGRPLKNACAIVQ